MPRIAKHSKNEIADILEAVFKTYGYEGTSLRGLAEATGLSKASLYHHFPRGKDDMAAYVLGRAGAKLQKLVLAPLQSSKPGKERFRESLHGVGLYYSGDTPVCLMNSLMVGRGADLFGEEILSAVKVWQKGLKGALEDAGVSAVEAGDRAEAMIAQIQGALVLCRLQKSRTPLETCVASCLDQV